MSNYKLTAEEQAVKDIKSELKSEKKHFISFFTYLNPVMECLVEQHIKKQIELTKTGKQ